MRELHSGEDASSFLEAILISEAMTFKEHRFLGKDTAFLDYRNRTTMYCNTQPRKESLFYSSVSSSRKRDGSKDGKLLQGIRDISNEFSIATKLKNIKFPERQCEL